MSLREAYVGVRVLETAHNYARADTPLHVQPNERHNDAIWFYDTDGDFWHHVLDSSEAVWGVHLHFGPLALSEWVARVPGLYWRPGADQMRKLSPAATEIEKEHWTQYTPWGKSQVVLGGVCTLRLPPSVDGTRLATLTTTLNVSAGVPALIAPDVWDKICQDSPHTGEGKVLRGQARWQPMNEVWASRFPSTRGIPRGYLVLNDPDAITIYDDISSTQIYPFTIMEYRSGAKELFDFVYAGADTRSPNYRSKLEHFFDRYKDERERYGRYLLAGDVINALWDAQYNSPADLCRDDPSARSQLALLEERVRERQLGVDTIDSLLSTLGTICTEEADLRRLSQEVGVEPAVWYQRASLAEICSQFVAEFVRQGQDKVEALIEVLVPRYDPQTTL